jgi:hypothetical protein
MGSMVGTGRSARLIIARDNRPLRVKPGLTPWGPHVRFRRVQTLLVREGSPLVKLRNSAYGHAVSLATQIPD